MIEYTTKKPRVKPFYTNVTIACEAPRGPRADSPPARVAKLGTKKRKAQKGRFRPLGSLLEATLE